MNFLGLDSPWGHDMMGHAKEGQKEAETEASEAYSQRGFQSSGLSHRPGDDSEKRKLKRRNPKPRMTLENRQFVIADEILAFRYTCNRCGAELCVSLRDQKKASACIVCQCPRCDHIWVADQSPEYKSITELFLALERLRFQKDNIGAQFQLEIDLEAQEGQGRNRMPKADTS